MFSFTVPCFNYLIHWFMCDHKGISPRSHTVWSQRNESPTDCVITKEWAQGLILCDHKGISPRSPTDCVITKEWAQGLLLCDHKGMSPRSHTVWSQRNEPKVSYCVITKEWAQGLPPTVWSQRNEMYHTVCFIHLGTTYNVASRQQGSVQN
jgi:nitrogen regulatory protein PII-like uncharacterized protein